MSESESTTEEIGLRRSSTCPHGLRDLQRRSTIEIPAMILHNDFIFFLAVAQYYEIDFVSLTWRRGPLPGMTGGTSKLWRSNAGTPTDFIFKRTTLADTSRLDSQDEEKAFNALVSEISTLSHPLIRRHQNIVKLEGICWEFLQRSHKVWSVLIFEEAQFDDLHSFMCSEQGRLTTMHDRLGLCTDIASAIIAMHSNCMYKSSSYCH